MASGYSDLSEIRKDGRNFGAYPKPPKIDLLNEKPRRESVVEQQLKSGIIRQEPIANYNNRNQQVFNTTCVQPASYMFNSSQRSQNLYSDWYEQQQQQQQNIKNNYPPYNNEETNKHNTSRSSGVNRYYMIPETDYYTTTVTNDSGPVKKTVTTTVRTTTTTSGANNDITRGVISNSTGNTVSRDNYYYNADQMTRPVAFEENVVVPQQHTQSKSTLGYSDIARELAEKEAQLKREIAYLNLHNSPWSRPKQIREPRREPPPKWARNDQRWVREVPNSPTSRPNSRASSTRSITTEQDLLEKAEKLLKDVQEIENKPLVTQQILIESGARRIGSNSNNINPSSPINKTQQDNSVSSVHTAIIKVPRGEINNKSPLPFAYDNFSTLGVRGNIASVGAAPPEKPYAPIFPMIKRTPSPTTSELNKRY